MCAFLGEFETEKGLWTAAFVVGFVLFMTGIFIFIRKNWKSDKRFAWPAFWEFLACWVLCIPVEIFNDNNNCPNQVLKWIEGILTALLKSINMYGGEGYSRVIYESDFLFSGYYGILRVLANIALLLFVGGFILKFLNGPWQQLKLTWRRKRYLYIFSTCNDKTLSIAKSIHQNFKNQKETIVFACMDNTSESSFREQVDLMEGIYVDGSVLDLIKKYAASASGMEIFLFEDIEENNIINLEEICTTLGNINNNKGIKIFAELSETPWDLYDNYIEKHGLNNRGIIINFVRTEETFVYSNLLKNSIFDKALEKDKIKKINAVIIGEMNARNIEMFKALMHLSQMPGYFLNLVVIENGHGQKHLRQMMPEIGDNGAGYGDALYHLNYLEGIGYKSNDVENAIKQNCPEFTFAFINAGEDLLNINLALQLKAISKRRGRKSDEYLLQVNIINRDIWDNWNMGLCEGIMPVGSKEDVYDYQFVTCSDIERASETIHKARHSSTPWINYLNNEYNRHSVFARTLSYKYKIHILGDRYDLAGKPEEPVWSSEDDLEKILNSMSPEEIVWKTYEHMRWNMYTRTLGYRADDKGLLTDLIKTNEILLYRIKGKKAKLKYASSEEEKQQLEDEISALQKEKKEVLEKVKDIRTAAKIHNDLGPFDELSLADKIKDNLELTADVVAALKEI